MNRLYDAIENWEIDADQEEDLPRLFFMRRDFRKILGGKIVIVTGRKGTGKTAIARVIDTKSRNDPETFSKLISLSSFPFNQAYKMEDENFPRAFRYLTYWKYCIYYTLAQMLNEDQSVKCNVPAVFTSIFSSGDQSSSRWNSLKFSASAVKVEGLFEITRDFVEKKIDMGNGVHDVENKLLRIQNRSVYYILIDQLDDSFQEMVDPDNREKFTSLMTGLFKAVISIRAYSRKELGIDIRPIVFVRDDIYDIIHDPDKIKWSSQKIDLNWTLKQIRELIRYRIINSTNCLSSEATFNKAWSEIFHHHQIEVGSRRKYKQSIFNYIAKSTFYRPRDFVQYIKICAKHAQQEDRRKITGWIVSARADEEYSSYLKEDLENEIVSVIPDIRYVFDMITFLGKNAFTFGEFVACYMAHVDSSGEAAKVRMRGPSTYLGPDSSKNHRDKIFYILSVLHWYGVIGSSDQSNRPTYRYKTRTNTALNVKRKLFIHRGLVKSLSIA